MYTDRARFRKKIWFDFLWYWFWRVAVRATESCAGSGLWPHLRKLPDLGDDKLRFDLRAGGYGHFLRCSVNFNDDRYGRCQFCSIPSQSQDRYRAAGSRFSKWFQTRSWIHSGTTRVYSRWLEEGLAIGVPAVARNWDLEHAAAGHNYWRHSAG